MSSNLKILHSTQDASVNFIQSTHGAPGFFESRYVRRTDDYFIVYLSSQSACNRGCGFCHLTTTGQTVGIDAQRANLFSQAKRVLDHYQSLNQPSSYVHFNFMARGEPLASQTIAGPSEGDLTLVMLGKLADEYDLVSKFNISTILPKTFKYSLVSAFRYTQPTFYYSLYSIDPDFRKRWLPGAMDVDDALDLLKEYQDFTHKRVKVHYAFIKGQNDTFADVMGVIDAVHKHELDIDFNVVRYNPPDGTSEESSEDVIQRHVETIRSRIDGRVQIVSRVGYDVKASCGMFVAERRFHQQVYQCNVCGGLHLTSMVVNETMQKRLQKREEYESWQVASRSWTFIVGNDVY